MSFSNTACLVSFLLLIFSQGLRAQSNYPSEWWAPVPRDGAPSWEVLPQDAGPGEVVLSKRHELGVFSNLGEAHFVYDGVRYNSVEGLWQMMKYPDPMWDQDPRHNIAVGVWPYTREQVMQLVGFESKRAGDEANKIYKTYGLSLVSYQGRAFDYKDMGPGSEIHYQIIREATRQKILQNPEVRALLIKTKGLKLIPDHNAGTGKPKSYYYCDILMDLRDHELI